LIIEVCKYRVVVQHGVRVDRNRAVEQIQQPVTAEETWRIDQTTKLQRHHCSHQQLWCTQTSCIIVSDFKRNQFTAITTVTSTVSHLYQKCQNLNAALWWKKNSRTPIRLTFELVHCHQVRQGGMCVGLSVCLLLGELKEVIEKFWWNVYGDVRCITSKNRLDSTNDWTHVMLGP